MLHKHKVFELVDHPRDQKVIKNRWVFNVKLDGHKKAHLVVKGFSQVEGLDFDQVFSLVVRFETVCLMLALAMLENWYITGLDVWSTYLYGQLNKEIYMEQPKGFAVPRQERKVLHLHIVQSQIGNCRGNPRVRNSLPLPLPSLYPYPPPRVMRVEGFLEGYRLIISAFTFTVTHTHIRHTITTIDYYCHCTSINDRTMTKPQ